MIGRSYVLVANNNEAALYALREEGTHLEPTQSWSNEYGKSLDQDIYTDRPGRQSAPSARIPGVDSMDRKDAAEVEAQRFAGDIVDWIDHRRKTDKIYNLHIIAEPGFLGKLRSKFTSPIEGLLGKVVTKNVVDADTKTLLNYL